ELVRNARRRDEHLRDLGGDLARVQRIAANTDATLQQYARPQTRLDDEVHAVPVLGHLAVFVRQRVEQVGRNPEVRRIQIEPGDRVSAAIGQPRVRWHVE